MGTRNEKVQIVVDAKDRASATMRSVGSSIGDLAKGFTVGTLAANVVTSALRFLWGELKSVISSAAVGEQQWNKMSAAIRRAGLDVESALPQFRAMTDELEIQSGVAGTELSAGFVQMTRAMVPVGEQYRIMKTAIDMSATSGDSLKMIIDTLIKSMSGKESSLRELAAKYGVATEQGESFSVVLDKINAKVGGAAQANMGGYAGAVKKFNIQYERFKKAIGTPIVSAAGNIMDVIGTTGMLFSGASGSLEVRADELQRLLTGLNNQAERFNSAGWFGGILSDAVGLQYQIEATGIELASITRQIEAQEAATRQAYDPTIADNMRIRINEIMDATIALQEEVNEVQFVRWYEGLHNIHQGGTFPILDAHAIQGVNQALNELNGEVFELVDVSKKAEKSAFDMQDAFGSFAGTFAGSFFSIANTAEDTWSRIAKSFQSLVLDTILNAIAPGSSFVRSFLGSFAFWDKRENDMALMREGQRAAMFIQRGMSQGMNNYAPQVSGSGYSGGSIVNVNISGQIIGEETWIRTRLLPMIQSAVEGGHSRIALAANNNTRVR